MNVAAIREEVINKFVKKVSGIESEETLNAILAFLDNISDDKASNVNLSRHYESIQKKYGDVLKRLSE